MATNPLISPAALRNALESDDDIVLIDAGRSRAAYELGHLVDARHADMNNQLASLTSPVHDASKGGRHPLPAVEEWCRTLGEWGIAPSTHVIVYDDQSGANAAARAWWMLRGVGHERVAVLDGGLREAVDIGFELTAALPASRTLPSYPATAWLLPTVDIDDVDTLRSDQTWRVVDVRSATRFGGLEEPIDPIAGHIPGAINVPFADNLEDGRFKSPAALRRMYEERLEGVDNGRVAVHCGSGVTACHTLLALEIAGMPGASLYVGSWSEWCRNPRPRACAGRSDGA